MDLYRFYVPDLRDQLRSGALARLPPDQGHHARAVLRLNAGEAVVLFDGRGGWVRARLESLGKSTTTAQVDCDVTVDPAKELQLTLATAVPKGDRAEWLIEQASQLDVAAVQWLDCDRGVVKPREGGGKIDKWRRLAIESAKQCGRTHVLEVHELAGLRDVIGAAGDCRVLWLEPGDGGKRVQEALDGARTRKIMALIGPEGGWSEAERSFLSALVEGPIGSDGEARVTRVHLTETVLRIETACAAVAALVMGS